MTGFAEWKAGDFTEWEKSGAGLNPAGEMVLDFSTAVTETDPYGAGGYYGGNFYNGGSYLVGEVISPEFTAEFNFGELIVSWNAGTPLGTWVEILASVKMGERWTKWYNLGVWASDTGTIQRHSVKLQGDSDGYVAVDTLVLTDKKAIGQTYQLKVRLFSTIETATPSVRYLSAAYSTSTPKKITASVGNQGSWNNLINVPECSQMVYPDGGNVWCSPTSVSMVLGYWGADPGPCEPRVRNAVAGVYDWIYDGHGNWVFNTAYAGSLGFTASVRRFASLNDVEPWVARDVPVVFSFAWGKNDLTGAAIDSSNGHLAVIVGLDDAGNPIVNDPAAALDEDVQRTYNRAELEAVWLTNSGGTVYIIEP
ncbi:MAG TPA: C39 family peptidase [Bellilinea sp.]|nr:C39 family peptidase [Bellilinea sp.]